MFFEEALLQREEQLILFEYLQKLQPKRILEIGSYKGGSTRLFHMAVPNAEIVCIEPNPLFAEFENVSIVRATTPGAFALLTGTFDFIFVDGNHSEDGCYSDLVNSRNFCHAQTKVVLHDANYYEVAAAIERAFKKEFPVKQVLFESTQGDGNVIWGGLVALSMEEEPETPFVPDNTAYIGSRIVKYRPYTFDTIVIQEMESQYQQVDYTQVSTVLDIGAHAGYFANMVIDRNPAAKIVSVEMALDNYELLKENTQGTNVRAVNAQVGYQLQDYMAIRWNDGNTGSGRLIKKSVTIPANTSELAVTDEAMTIEDLFVWYDLDRVDVLKLDCEGSEFNILEHVQNKTVRNIHYIVGEYHSSAKDARKLLDTFCKKHKVILKEFSGTDGLGFFYIVNENF